jgi:hypothetical protein
MAASTRWGRTESFQRRMEARRPQESPLCFLAQSPTQIILAGDVQPL